MNPGRPTPLDPARSPAGAESATTSWPEPSLAALRIKRILDIVGAALLLVVLVPALTVIAAAVKLSSPGPALFIQSRIGRDGRPFRLLKFRTMASDAEALLDELRAQSHDPHWLLLERDPRVTRVGRVLRMASLDELPQLWNVLRGDMSLVGPRPLVEREHRLVADWASQRTCVRPGLTGLWQVGGRTSVSFEEMLTLDIRYVRGWSLRRDVALLVRTVPAVLTGRGAN
jgi:lipopolysaccharide/colanic/teichoic acid biosynthesis glycosyltransferase